MNRRQSRLYEYRRLSGYFHRFVFMCGDMMSRSMTVCHLAILLVLSPLQIRHQNFPWRLDQRIKMWFEWSVKGKLLDIPPRERSKKTTGFAIVSTMMEGVVHEVKVTTIPIYCLIMVAWCSIHPPRLITHKQCTSYLHYFMILLKT